MKEQNPEFLAGDIDYSDRPTWRDACYHESTEFICSFSTYVKRPKWQRFRAGPLPFPWSKYHTEIRFHDLYVYNHVTAGQDAGICIRNSHRCDDYYGSELGMLIALASRHELDQFSDDALTAVNCHVIAARNILRKRGCLTWSKTESKK